MFNCRVLLSVCLILCVSIALFAADQPRKEITGQVVQITDGDSITIADEAAVLHKVRLLGVDAPEIGQPFSDKSKQNLEFLLKGKTVRLAWDVRDRGGRIRGDVYHVVEGREVWINYEQLRGGFAWHDEETDKRDTLADAAKGARSVHRGLWREENPEAPWVFRKKNEKRKAGKS